MTKQPLLLKEVINLIDEQLPEELYLSFSLVGSKPPFLEPRADIDLLFIVKNDNKDEFFTKLNEICCVIEKENPRVTHSFIKGPIKHDKKGLIHLIAFLETPPIDASDLTFCFEQDDPRKIRSHCKKAKLIRGKPLNECIKGVDLNNQERIEQFVKRDKQQLKKLETGSVALPTWRSDTAGKWSFVFEEINLDDYLKEHMKKYYQKSISGGIQ